MNNPRILIIGAGPCGLGAGWRLAQLGVPSFHIYEKEHYVGGLASSFVDPNGFTWDVGGHVLHSHYPYFDAMFEDVMQGEYFTHQRESWVWIYDRFVPYPFQNNIHRLPETTMRECLEGLKEREKNPAKKPKNFAQWIRASFGTGIAKHFLLPYNRKVWAYSPDKMNYQWTGDRVATVDLARIEKNIKERRDDVSWGPNAVFHFPKHGGTGEIWKRVAQRFTHQLSLGKAVSRIEGKKKKVLFSDGTSDTYDVLLTTIPLDRLVRMIDGITLPAERPLRFSNVTVVGIGIGGHTPQPLRTKCWMYFPESLAPFFRATVFSNYSKFNAPKGSWSLMTEIASSPYRPLPNGDIARLALQGAKRTGLIPTESKIESMWSFQTDHGYPIPTLGRDRYLDQVLPALAACDIYSRGRFGAWKYEVSNQDHTFMQGVEWVNRIINNDEEVTVMYPNQVNHKKK